MAMTNAQIAAFKVSTGGTSPADLLLGVVSALAIIYLLWLAWIAHSQFRSWQTGQSTFYDLIFTIARAAMVALLVGFTLTK